MLKNVTLETAKKLVEAGIVLGTDYYYQRVDLKKEKFYRKLSYEPTGRTFLRVKKDALEDKPLTEYDGDKDKPIFTEVFTFYPAPDIAELLDALPKWIKNCTYLIVPIDDIWKVGYGTSPNFEHKELVEALAQLLIWVKTTEVNGGD